MALERLIVEGFRNLQPLDIVLDRNINFIHGLNGAGKSSLLEAVSFLGMGRSFRTRKYTLLINREKAKFDLFCTYRLVDGEVARIGISKGRGISILKMNSSPIVKAADLAKVMPLQTINSQSFALLEGGPKQRRQFIDWLVFHVKHGYGDLWSAASRCVKQRNALLRGERPRRADFEYWDAELIKLTSQINRARHETLELFLRQSQEFLQECGFGHIDESGQSSETKRALDIRFVQGWAEEEEYNTVLKNNFSKDCALGYTSAGFHKADLKFLVGNRQVIDVYSRGQQKAIISALYLAQIKTLKEFTGKSSVLLVDDLPAEMDINNIALFASWLQQLEDVQSLVTGIDLNELIQQWPKAQNPFTCKVFHVKQGQIIEEPCNWSNS